MTGLRKIVDTSKNIGYRKFGRRECGNVLAETGRSGGGIGDGGTEVVMVVMMSVVVIVVVVMVVGGGK